MKYAYIILLSLFIHFFATAQNNFRQGYIITNTNDSITGWIDFRTDLLNSHVCRFKPAEKAEVELYYPGSIAKYRFINEGKYYVSRSITVDNQVQQVFLEYLVSGIMNLYYYKDPVSEQDYYFFENENGDMLPVTKKPDELVDMKIKTDQRYIGTLIYLFNDYPAIRKEVNSTSFNRGSMIRLTKEYHTLACTTGEKCIDFENDYKKQFIKLKFSIYAGLQIINYELKEKELAVFGSTSSLFPVIGGQLGISNPRLSNSFSLLADVSFSGIKGEGEQNDGQVVYKKYKVDALTAIGRLNVLYTYPSGKFRPIAECGLSYYRLFNRSSSLYQEVCTLPITAEVTDNYLLPNSFFVGFNFGTGFNYRMGNDRFLFCRLSFEQVNSTNVIQCGQLKFGIIF